MNATSQRIGVWCGLAFVLLFFAGLAIAGFLPPLSPGGSAQAIADLYVADQSRIKAGAILLVFASALTLPWVSAISVQLKRIEGPDSPMAFTQLVAGATGVLILIIPPILWQVAAYRPESRPAEATQQLNDMGWMLFVGVTSLAMVQSLAIAIAILLDKNEVRVFPRWVAYFNVMCELMFIPGGFLAFFKTGPLAWDGAFSFWVPAAAFGGWFIVMFFAMLGAITRQERHTGEVYALQRP